MLSNIDGSVIYALMIIVLIAVIAIMAGGVIWAIINARKNNSPKFNIIVVYTFASVIIAAASWIFNMGWLRFIMTILALPMIHGITFFVSNMFFAGYADKSPKVPWLNFMYTVTYLLTYLLFPDGSDYGEMYFFFGLIQSNILSYAASVISSIAFTAHIVLFIMQIVEIVKIKKSILRNNVN